MVELAIANQPPVYSTRSAKGDPPQARLQGTVNKITVAAGYPLAPLGALVA
jgi:hypothetical protein